MSVMGDFFVPGKPLGVPIALLVLMGLIINLFSPAKPFQAVEVPATQRTCRRNLE
jgi:hypothetical protein